MKHILDWTPKRWIRLLTLASGATLLASGAFALQVKPMKFNEVIEQSEHIFTAVCEEKSSAFKNGNIFTTYKLRPKDVWKGKLPLNKDGLVEMEELGGSATGQVLDVPGRKNKRPSADASESARGVIRLGQYAGGGAAMIIGEEVLLFTRTSKPNPALEAQGKMSPFAPNNIEITGRIYGRFTILTDPTTGSKHVSRMSIEDRGVIPSDQSVRGFLNAQQRVLAASKDSKLQGNEPLSSDALLDRLGANQDAHKKIEKGKAESPTEAGSKEIRNFDLLEDVKSKVTEIVGPAKP